MHTARGISKRLRVAWASTGGTSIFTRLMLSQVLVLGVCVGLTLGVFTLLSSAFVNRFHTYGLLEQAKLVADMVSPELAVLSDANSGVSVEVQERVQRWGRLLSSGVWVVAPDGRLLVNPLWPPPRAGVRFPGDRPPRLGWRPPQLHWELSQQELSLVGSAEPQIIPADMLSSSFMYGVYVPVFAEGRYLGAVFVHSAQFNLVNMGRGVRQAIYLGAGIALLLALGVAYQVSQRMSRPILRMRKAAEQMAQGDFSTSLPVNGPLEIQSLAASMNMLCSQLAVTLMSLQEEKDRFASLIEGMSEGVIAVDTKQRVTLTNPPAQQYFPGLSLGNPVVNAVPEIGAVINTALATGMPQQCDVSLVHSAAAKHHQVLTVTVAPITGTGAVAVLRDATEERLYQQLQQEFVANVSHELRTPIALIQGYLEALQDGFGADPAKAHEFITIVYNETMRLRRLVEDLLTLSAVEANGSQAEEVDLVWLAQDVAQMVKPMFDDKQVGLHVEVAEGTADRLYVAGQAERLKQVLLNLLDNALRHTLAQAQVRVLLAADNGNVHLSVCDEGCGIPAEHLPFLFNRFYRVQEERGRDSGGTGLGLAIVKSIVQAHGGSIDVQSTPGIGTTFHILIPQL